MNIEARYHVFFVTALFIAGITEGKPEPSATEIAEGVELYGDPPLGGGGESRIVGGQRAVYRQFPYQVSLQEKNYHICGGSLLDDQHVLTAAHCVTTQKAKLKKAKDFTIGVGSTLLSGLTKHQVTHIWIHRQYRLISGMPNHDIALVRVKCCVLFSPTVQPVALWTGAPIPVYTRCNVSGWGAEVNEGAGTSYLNYVNVPVRRDAECRASYGSLPTYPICAGETYRDSCQGDSGGPLVCNQRQAGIVSFGINCGLHVYPGVYTDVFYYLTWIDETRARSNAAYISPTVTFILLLNLLLIFGKC